MTAVVCAGCGVSQQEGAPFCAACGRAFPRTGLPVMEPQQTPRGQVQQAAAAAQARQGSASGGVPLVTSRPPITTEVEVYTATQIPSAGMTPKQQLEAPYARVGKRFLALLIDGAIAGVLGGIVAGIGLLFIETPDPLVVQSQEQEVEMAAQLLRLYLIAGAVAFAFMLSMWIWESRTGRTVGNSAMGLRTVSADDRGPLGFGRELIRVLMLGVISMIPVAGPVIVHLTPLWDKGDKVQGWHDKVARSVVLDLRAPKIAVTTGLAPVGSGPRAPGRPALRTATPSAPVQQTSRQMPSQAPAAPQHPSPQYPGTPPVAAPDPWSFPQSPAAPAAGGGIITGIPESAPGAPPAAQPVQQPQQPQPVQAQQPQPVHQQPQPPESAWPSKTWPAAQEAAAPPVQQPAAPPIRHELPPQQHPESRPTRPVSFPGDGAAQPPAQAEELWEATRMQAPSLVPAAVVTVVLELESGARHVIDGPALVGRNPQAADGSPTILVRVDDPTRSVSKNHAEMGVDPAGLWLTDRGSTNGTVVSAPGRSPQVAEPGARVRVPMGSTIHVGDRRIVVHPDESKA